MISAPSRLLRSNGNKLPAAAAVLLLALTLSSCALFRVAADDDQAPVKTDRKEELDDIAGTKVIDPKTGLPVIIPPITTEKMDTIRWRDVPTDSIPPIVSEAGFTQETGPGVAEKMGNGEFGTERYSFYNVAVLLPFLSDRYAASSEQIPEQSSWALNFYGGMRMALDQLTDEGVKLRLTVMDTRGSDVFVRNLLNGRYELLNAHLVIGTSLAENTRHVAEFAKRRNITFVSPFIAAANITADNPNYLQVKPTLASHCAAIMQDARQNFRPRRVVLVGREAEGESARFVLFQEENYRLAGTRHDSVRLREFVIKGKDYQNLRLAPYLTGSDTTVFILPAFANDDESFVFSFLSQLKAAKPANTYVAVYGMPRWMSYERIDLNLYENLNVRVSSAAFIDPYNETTNFFRRRFFDRYGVVPPEEAFLGYDVMLYFGRMIHKYGTKFQYFMERDPQQMLHTRFDLERVVPFSAAGRESSRIDRFENKFVNILKFRDFLFQP